MEYERYQDLTATLDFLEYEFESTGPKGNIRKIIQFKATGNPEIFNLAFGNKNMDGTLNDISKDGNSDRNKILATVVSSVYLFTSQYPDKWVFFSGSNLSRTRLYRMAISLNIEKLSVDFEIYGILKDLDSFVYVQFQKEVNYFGFLIRKRIG